MLKNLLAYRFAIFNSSMAALFGYFISQGYVALAIAGDPTGMTLLIASVFLLLFGSTVFRVWKTSTALNRLKRGETPKGQPWTKRLTKISHIHKGGQWLAYLGLIGTVIGFIMALGGVDLASLSAVAGVKSMIPQLMIGMKVAMYTTLAGSFFGIWTEVNYQMLETATACLVEDEKASWDS